MAVFNSDFGLTKKILLLIFFAAAVGLIYVLATQYTTEMHKEFFVLTGKNEQPAVLKTTGAGEIKYREQRNMLSRQLNEMKKAYGQQSCNQLNILKEAGKPIESRVSENGGWCSDASSPNSTVHMWDKGFSTSLSKFCKGKTVGSFGDGPGEYKKHIDTLGEVTSYTAYDGAPFCEKVTNGRVIFLDLTAPQFGLTAFDWVVSVEVGEHIPAKYEDVYMDNLVRHAKEGIILSWAVPGQGGLSHVNNKALSDVVAKMDTYGFSINKGAGEPLRSSSHFSWLKGNIHVYYRKDPKTFIPEDA